MNNMTCKARTNYDRSSWLTLVLVAILILQSARVYAAQNGFEQPQTLNASQILPPELLSGPNHRVEEKVANDGSGVYA